MLRIINYNSGELEFTDGTDQTVRLTQDTAHRLILAARMHSVDSFLAKLPTLLPNKEIADQIAAKLLATEKGERWHLKEKIARLCTITKDHVPDNPDEVCEEISI